MLLAEETYITRVTMTVTPAFFPIHTVYTLVYVTYHSAAKKTCLV